MSGDPCVACAVSHRYRTQAAAERARDDSQPGVKNKLEAKECRRCSRFFVTWIRLPKNPEDADGRSL